MTTHVKVIAVLFIVFGALGLLFALFSSVIFGALATFVGTLNDQNSPAGVAALGLTGIALTTFLIVVSIPYIVCGWGMLTLRPWSRILGIILAAISLVRIPIGTIFGIYALVILFNKETEALFAKR
jgi:hypothetical protein